MKRPSLDLACKKFVTAVAKNAPRTETNLDAEQIVALCQSVLRPRIEKMCAAGFRIESFAEAKERNRIERIEKSSSVAKKANNIHKNKKGIK